MDTNTLLICITTIISICIVMGGCIYLATQWIVSETPDLRENITRIEAELARITELEDAIGNLITLTQDYPKQMDDLAEIKTNYSNANIRNGFSNRRN